MGLETAAGTAVLPLGIEDIRRARQRIGQHVRRTPLIEARLLREPIAPSCRLWLKLECLQVTGSFKARGAVSKLLSLDRAAVGRGLVTASGGNHGVGVAYAGWIAGTPATVYFPRPTPSAKVERVERWGARVVLEGDVWDEANDAAKAHAERDGLAYVHAFADREVIAGQGTIGLEVLEDAPQIDRVVIAVGGGGLIAGVAMAVRTLRPDVRITGVEPVGAPTLRASLDAGRVVELPQVTTAAGTLAPRRSSELNFNLVREWVDDIVLVSDEEMRHAARWLWLEMGIAAELSGAAALSALQTGRVVPRAGESVCVLVCGAGSDGLRADAVGP